jgi:DNA replication protein DnaC
MLKQPMIEKLAAMRLLGMVDALKAQEQDPTARELSFLERFGLLVDQQWNWRENQALSRRLKNAKLRTANASVEEIDFRTARGLDKSVIRSLTKQSAWVRTHENIFVIGPTREGKRFVACALAQKACRDECSALYTRAQSLFRDLVMARADGSLRGLLARLSRIDVLVIDDWAMAPLSEPEPRLLGDLRRPLPGAFDHLDLAAAGFPLARADRRPDTGRRYSRPPRPQCSPHRDAWRFDA